MNNETTASQPKSIGDDEQFRKLMLNFMNYATATLPLREQPEYRAIAEFLDNFRAPADQASATIQAAPDDAIEYCRSLAFGWRVAGLKDKEWAANFIAAGLAERAATIQKPESDLTACANCLRPKCEHNGKLCPLPYTTHWHAWDYASQPQPAYPEYASVAHAATIQEPVMAAEPVGENINGPMTDAQKQEARHLYRNLHHLGPDAMEDVVRFASVCGYVNGSKDFAEPVAPMVADPAGVALDKLRVHYVEGLENGGYYLCTDVIRALAATVKAVPSDALELTELADAMQYWGGVFADGFAEAGDAVRSRGYSDERWVNARIALEWMRNRLYKHGKMGHPDAHAKYGSPFPGAAPLADKTGGGE